jgi:hypothetical protein
LFRREGPERRFAYIAVEAGGQAVLAWSRRMKIDSRHAPIGDVRRGMKGRILEAVIVGSGKDGTPACATVPAKSGERWLGETVGTHFGDSALNSSARTNANGREELSALSPKFCTQKPLRFSCAGDIKQEAGRVRAVVCETTVRASMVDVWRARSEIRDDTRN